MNSEMAGLTDLRARLEAQGDEVAHVRALLRRSGPNWVLHHVWALVGSEPPDWSEATWQYEHLVFVACSIPASTLATMCSDTDTEVVRLGDLNVAIPRAATSVQRTHEP